MNRAVQTSGLLRITYTYDDAGNRLTEIENRQKAVNTYNPLINSGDFEYAYEANGNLTDVNGSLKSFNLLNRIDTFGTTRKSETAEDYYLYTDDRRGSTVNVLDSSADKVVSYNMEYIGFDDIFYVSRKAPCEASPLAGDICAKESSIPSCVLFLLV